MNTNTPSEMNKYTSIKVCIIDSWKEFATHTKSYFKYLWFHFLIAGLGFALFSAESNWIYTQHILPIEKLTASGMSEEVAKAIYSPSWQVIGIGVLALLAYLIANYIMMGSVYSQIRFFKATDSLPTAGPFSFWREVRKDGVRAFSIDILLAFVISLITAVVFLIAKFTSLWVLLIMLPVLIYFSVIGTCGRMLYVVEKLSLKEAIKGAFKTGHHKFGGYLILLILTSIPLSLLIIIAMQPVMVFNLANNANALTQLAGDPSGIPPYTLPLYILTATAAMFICCIGYALQQMPLALYTAAVRKK